MDRVSLSIIMKRKTTNGIYGTQLQSENLDLQFLLLTSNVLEQFSSAAKYTYSGFRQSLLPQNLEQKQLFLKVNKKNIGITNLCQKLSVKTDVSDLQFNFGTVQSIIN